MSALLELHGLRKAFADFTAVDGVDLALPPGGITAIIGPNGAGKTTLINLVSGKLLPDAGSVLLEGADVTRMPLNSARSAFSRIARNESPRGERESRCSAPVETSTRMAANQ